MQSIKEYKLIIGNLPTFEKGMTEALKEGYQPYGGPFMKAALVCQAVVRYETIDKTGKMRIH